MKIRHNTIVIIGWFTIIVSLLVLIGWIFNIPFLTSVLPQFATMKFLTAVSFLLTGMILLSVHSIDGKDPAVSQVILSLSSLTIMLFMVTLLSASLLNFTSGLEQLFIEAQSGAILEIVPGRPSIGTMFSFLLIGILGMFSLSKSIHKYFIYGIFGTVLLMIGSMALVGYALSIPPLFFAFASLSSAMAIHTAFLFALIGFGLIVVFINHVIYRDGA